MGGSSACASVDLTRQRAMSSLTLFPGASLARRRVRARERRACFGRPRAAAVPTVSGPQGAPCWSSVLGSWRVRLRGVGKVSIDRLRRSAFSTSRGLVNSFSLASSCLRAANHSSCGDSALASVGWLSALCVCEGDGDECLVVGVVELDCSSCGVVDAGSACDCEGVLVGVESCRAGEGDLACVECS